MSVFDRIEQAKEEARATGQSVTLQLSDEEFSEWEGKQSVVPAIYNDGGTPLNVQRDQGSGPVRVYLENGTTLVAISI